MTKYYVSFLGLVCCVVFLAGCQKSSINTVPVDITVTYKGAAVEGALVTLNPAEKGSDIRSASGMTKADGKVVPMTPPGAKGALPGKYVVTIMKTPTIGNSDSGDTSAAPSQSYEELMAANQTTKPGNMVVDAKHQLPLKYTSEKTSGLDITVEKGQANSWTFDLTD